MPRFDERYHVDIEDQRRGGTTPWDWERGGCPKYLSCECAWTLEPEVRMIRSPYCPVHERQGATHE
jgi:hypothetical protein